MTNICKYRLRTYLANWYSSLLICRGLAKKKSSWENKILCLDDMVLLFSLSTFKSMHAGPGRRTFSGKIPLTLFLFYVYKSAGLTELIGTSGEFVPSCSWQIHYLTLFHSRIRLLIQHRATRMSKILVGTNLYNLWLE